MSIERHETPSAATFDVASLLREFWRLPSMTVARFTLLSYVRSGWILGDIVIVWLLYAAFFLEFGGNVAYFFGTAGQGLGALAIIGPVVMVQRAMNARVYLPLSRMTSRSSYIRGLVIAAGVLRLPLNVMMMLLALGYHNFEPSFGIEGATVTNMTVGMLGLLVACVILSTLTVAFSAPIATRLARIGLLAWLAAVLYTSTGPGSNPVATVLSVSRIPLIPLSACLNFGPAGSIDWSGLLALLIACGYIVGLTLLAEYWMARRDLLLH